MMVILVCWPEPDYVGYSISESQIYVDLARIGIFVV